MKAKPANPRNVNVATSPRDSQCGDDDDADDRDRQDHCRPRCSSRSIKRCDHTNAGTHDRDQSTVQTISLGRPSHKPGALTNGRNGITINAVTGSAGGR
jgi:hypothetical protein